jgi:hypothetical protein
MILSISESQSLCEWLMDRGLGLGECAAMLVDLACGDTFAMALIKVFIDRKNKLEAIHAQIPISDWGNPITP